MKGSDCQTVRDLLPGWAAESLSPADGAVVEAHLRSCEDCRSELDLVRAVRSARPEPPPDLEARIQARVREEFGRAPGRVAEKLAPAEEVGPRAAEVVSLTSRRRWTPAWALSAAAVVVLALGTALLWNQRGSELIQDPTAVAAQEPLPESWLWDDGIVAGAVVFDGLSDEDLEALIEEFEG